MTLALMDNLCDTSAGSHRIDSVSIQLLPIVWPHILPFLEKSLDPYTTPEDILRGCKEDKIILWVIHTSEAIVGVVTTLIGQGCGAILQCGGENMKDWFTMSLATIEDHFRQNGCERYQLAGRKGWKKYINFDNETHLFTKVL